MSADTRASDSASIRNGHRATPEHPQRTRGSHPKPSTASGPAPALGWEPRRAAPERSVQPRNTSTRPRIAKYRLHKASGQAVVTLDGRDHYLGLFGSESSKAAYERLIASYLAGGRKPCDHYRDGQRLTATARDPLRQSQGALSCGLTTVFLRWAASVWVLRVVGSNPISPTSSRARVADCA